MTYAVISILKSLIRCIKLLLYPKNSRTLYNNFHESESNACLKSINIRNPAIFLVSVACRRSQINLVNSLIYLPLMKPVLTVRNDLIQGFLKSFYYSFLC